MIVTQKLRQICDCDQYLSWPSQAGRVGSRKWKLTVESQVSGHDKRQFSLDDTQTTIDLTRYLSLSALLWLATGELELAGIVAPVLNDNLLRACLNSMLSRDSELRELLRPSDNLMLTAKTLRQAMEH